MEGVGRYTLDQSRRPRPRARQRGAAGDGLGDVAVPDGVQVGVVVAVLDVDAVAADLETFAVQRLAYVACEL